GVAALFGMSIGTRSLPEREGPAWPGPSRADQIFFRLLHLAKIGFISLSAAFAASAGVILPCATCANICGIRKVLKISSMAAFEYPGKPMLAVYLRAIVSRIRYLPLGGW